MPLNYRSLIQKLTANFKDLIADYAPDAIGATASYLIGAVERLSDLGSGGLNHDYIKARWIEEKDILRSELLSFEIMAGNIQDTIIDLVVSAILTEVL